MPSRRGELVSLPTATRAEMHRTIRRYVSASGLASAHFVLVSSRRRHLLAHAVSWFVELALVLAAWFLFTGKFDGAELLVGAIASAVAATAATIVREQKILRFGAHARDLAPIVLAPRLVVTETWEVLGVLARDLLGRAPPPPALREMPFEDGGDDREATMRRALATVTSSITPNTIVLGFDRKRGRMIFHQLKRADVSEMMKQLGTRRR